MASLVSVVHQDVGLLQRGREVQALGANIVVADIFDSGLQHLLTIITLADVYWLRPKESLALAVSFLSITLDSVHLISC